MKHKSFVIYASAFLLVLAANTWLFIRYKNISEQSQIYEREMVDCKERTETANLSTALLAHSVANSYKYDCFHIDDLLLEDTKGKKQMLSDVLQEGCTPKLVFFFSYLNC